MAEKEKYIKEKVDHSGVFNFSEFYAFAHEWLKDEGYGVVEEKYSEKVSGAKRDITIEWRATKYLSDYFKIDIFIKFEVKELEEIEAEIDGKKKKMNRGKVSAEITGNMIRDPQSKWDSTPFYRFLRDTYNKYIIPARVDKLEDKIKDDVKDFKEELKGFLALSGKR